jgi:hypothetical protein
MHLFFTARPFFSARGHLPLHMHSFSTDARSFQPPRRFSAREIAREIPPTFVQSLVTPLRDQTCFAYSALYSGKTCKIFYMLPPLRLPRQADVRTVLSRIRVYETR